MDTRNFKRSEFECHCGCGKSLVSRKLLYLLQCIRDDVGFRMDVNSGYRCIDHNKAVGGGTNSQHLYGMAADIKINSTNQRDALVSSAESYGFGGIGIYPTFVHLDIRNGNARWSQL